MPQSTNLNKSPYFDDFNEDKDYYKVLFKPGISVQTRELNNLQSILQSQIERFGNSFFTNGGVVVPGGFNYDPSFYSVGVEETFNGVDVENYYENLIGVTIQGKVSGIKAIVTKVLSRLDSERENTTLYIKYISSSQDETTESFTGEFFKDSEELITLSDIKVGESYIFANSEFAKTISPVERTSTSIASAAKINSGVYFVRGFFVNVDDETIILDQYSNTPSYRVGLSITENLIDSDEDPSLNDNAQGFSNYAAPGADRLKITLNLTKKTLDDFNDTDFIELFRVESGILKFIKKDDKYSFITDILARRTYDESGNYYVSPINVESFESLNDRIGNNGVYLENEKTFDGSTPSEDLGVLKVSPGKVYVKGYEISVNTTIVDYPKPRESKSVESSSASFYAGEVIRVNNVKGSPTIGLTTSYTVSLLNKRIDQFNIGTATTIGVARVYDFESHNTSYSNQSSQFNLNLFDIQTYTSLTISSSISELVEGAYILGKNSNSSGFLKKVSGTSLTLYQVSGNFSIGENLIINGIEYSQTVTSVRDYSIDDIKTIYSGSETSGISTFRADTLLSKSTALSGLFFVNVGSTGIVTITSNNGSSFASGLKVNDILEYSRDNISLPIYVGITSIFASLNKIETSAVPAVPNVCSDSVGSSTTYQISDLKLKKPQIVINPENSSLYTQLANSNIKDISTLNSSIFVKKVQNIDRGGAPTTTVTLNTLVGDYVYSSYDEERYTIVNEDGSIEDLSSATFARTNGNRDAEFTNLSSKSGVSKVITTQIKSNITSKYKKLNRCGISTVEFTKYTSSPTGSGLSTSTVYGLRVEDDQISLNIPDVLEIHGIYQSSGSSSASLPTLTLTGIEPTSDLTGLIIGELIVGQESGASALLVNVDAVDKISIVYKNENRFLISEKVTFSESGYTSFVSAVEIGDQNIKDNFILDNGQRQHFYDFARIIRKNNIGETSRKLKVIYDYFSYEPTDNGDVVTSNSYPSNLLKKKIPLFNNIRNSDVIDVRPRVSTYIIESSSFSPFEFSSRNFTSSGSNPIQILKSNEDFIFDYSFYLPRTDKLTISKDGSIDLVLGVSDENPKIPEVSKEVLDLATIYGSSYVYDIDKDVSISLTDNKRYTMADLRNIENRISNLEETTTLNLLEVSTNNLLIEDSEGFNRFKAGFFVDNFSNYDTSDITNASYRANVSSNTLSPESISDRINLTLYSNDNQVSPSEINLNDTNCSNLKITGNTITLNYSTVDHVKQPFASRIININPYNVVSWVGNLKLNPSSDTWTVDIFRETNVPNANLRGQSRTSVTREPIPYIRSRNIEFIATRLKPNTRFKLLFDSRDLSSRDQGSTYAFPKLLEVSNVSGSFAIGETVKVYTSSRNVFLGQFRICTPNHKSGPHNNPTSTYNSNPYNTSLGFPNSYGPQSTFINVDTSSLQISNVSDFFGNVLTGCYLLGQTSKASAIVSDNKLVSDDNGTLIGSIFIPNPEENSVKYRTGTTPTQVTQYSTLNVPGEIVSSAEATFTSSGDIVTTTRINYYDPVAQTFEVTDLNGIFPSSVDVYFASKDSNIPVTLQIREVFNGIPGGPDKVVGNLEKILNPSEVNISSKAETPTTFNFDTLTRLEGGKEYAIVLISDSFNYNVWISRLGEVEIATANKSEVEKVIINTQPSLGSFFISQNGTTWTPVQTDDLKFTLKKCKFSTSGGTARFYNSKSSINSTENKLPQNPISVGVGTDAPNDGRYMRIIHPNHGMHSPGSKVVISGVMPDSLPNILTVGYGITFNGAITLNDTSNFIQFENSPVDPVFNPGYIIMNQEIIKYTGVSGNTLTGISRAQNSTVAISHPQNSLVYKYEFNNVSLLDINKEHTISSIEPTEVDSYYVNIYPKLFLTTKVGGGSNVYASKNILFREVGISSSFVTSYNKTSSDFSIRTISATSSDGNESSFVDQGYKTIGIGNSNIFSTIRMVASKSNESEFINETQFPGKKSLSLDINLNTSDSNVSPVIDINNSFITTKSYRINSPIVGIGYTTDRRVNSNTDDPHAFIYISNRIDLLETANSIKVIFDAYRPSRTDIRVLYKIYRNDVPDEDQVWELFPGYNNLDVNGNIKSIQNNNGSSDSLLPLSIENQYLEYTYTRNNLPNFTGFAIKIVCSSTNNASSPLIKNLRSIALK
jgi:hypothetical protein